MASVICYQTLKLNVILSPSAIVYQYTAETKQNKNFVKFQVDYKDDTESTWQKSENRFYTLKPNLQREKQ